MLQIILQTQIASDEGYFSFKKVAQGIPNRLIRRHSHVFGDMEVFLRRNPSKSGTYQSPRERKDSRNSPIIESKTQSV